MSVIVWDGTRLAADRQLTVDGLRTTTCKLIQNEDSWAAWIGDYHRVKYLLDWIATDQLPWSWTAEEDGQSAEVIKWTNDGRFMSLSHGPYWREITECPFATGSGGALALGAMAAGASAPLAVIIAQRYDIYCGGGVVVTDGKNKFTFSPGEHLPPEML
jgi:hypothetical protein